MKIQMKKLEKTPIDPQTLRLFKLKMPFQHNNECNEKNQGSQIELMKQPYTKPGLRQTVTLKAYALSVLSGKCTAAKLPV